MKPRTDKSFIDVDGVAWPVHGAEVAIVDAAGHVLLQFRPWPPGWELPGGHCEDGEDPAAAAAREAEEETGLHIKVERLVGVYTWAGLRSAGDAVYLAHATGGTPRRSIEAWSSRWFEPTALPRTIFPWMRQRIVDAIAAAQGREPIHRTQPVTLYHIALFATAWLAVPLDRLLRHGRHPTQRK